MRGGAHAALGAAAAIPLAMLAGPGWGIPLALAGALGGLLPDIDHPGSTLGRWVPWPAVAVENHRTGFVAHGRRWWRGHIVWHRHETHSLGAAAIAAVATAAALCGPLGRWVVWAAHLLGHHLPLAGPAGAAAAWAGCAVCAGYLSHLAADLPSPSPQMLLWPFSRRLIRPRWVPRVPERSPAGRLLEAVVTVAAAGAALVAGGVRLV